MINFYCSWKNIDATLRAFVLIKLPNSTSVHYFGSKEWKFPSKNSRIFSIIAPGQKLFMQLFGHSCSSNCLIRLSKGQRFTENNDWEAFVESFVQCSDFESNCLTLHLTEQWFYIIFYNSCNFSFQRPPPHLPNPPRSLKFIDSYVVLSSLRIFIRSEYFKKMKSHILFFCREPRRCIIVIEAHCTYTRFYTEVTLNKKLPG